MGIPYPELSIAIEKYRRIGMVVMPLDGKRPILRDWQHLERTASRGWVGDGSQNIGLVCGVRADGGAAPIVIDLDGPAAIEEFEKHAPADFWAGAVYQVTGHGRHVFFEIGELADLKNAVKIWESPDRTSGIDIRTTGGQVVVEPSVHPETGRRYTFGPNWLDRLSPCPPEIAQWIRAQIAARRAPTAPVDRPVCQWAPTSDRYYEAALTREAASLASTPEGGRHNAMNLAAYRIGQLAGDDPAKVERATDVLTSAAQACGLPSHDIDRTISDGLAAGATAPRATPAQAVAYYAAAGDMPRARSAAEVIQRDQRVETEDEIDAAAIADGAQPLVRLPPGRGAARGEIKPTTANFGIIGKYCTIFEDVKLNTFKGQVFVGADPLTDLISLEKKREFTSRVPLVISPERWDEIMTLAAAARQYDPVRQDIERARRVWESHRHDEEVAACLYDRLVDAMRISPDYRELARSGLRVWIRGAVARALRPGTKFDLALTLAGAQGGGKSTWVHAIAGPALDDYVTDTQLAIDSTDAYIAIRHAWLVELAELGPLRSRDQAAYRAFLSASVDRYRSPYGRVIEDHPRHCAFVATTNERDAVFREVERRILYIRTDSREGDMMDLDLVRTIRDDLIGCAAAEVAAGRPLYLDTSTREAQVEMQERDCTAVQTIEERLTELIEEGYRGQRIPPTQWPSASTLRGEFRAGVSLSRIAELLDIAPRDIEGLAAQRSLTAAVRACGFTQARRHIDGRRNASRVWVREGN